MLHVESSEEAFQTPVTVALKRQRNLTVMQTIRTKNETGNVETGLERRLSRWRNGKNVQNVYSTMNNLKKPTVALKTALLISRRKMSRLGR